LPNEKSGWTTWTTKKDQSKKDDEMTRFMNQRPFSSTAECTDESANQRLLRRFAKNSGSQWIEMSEWILFVPSTFAN
jgi:hypothetical protein